MTKERSEKDNKGETYDASVLFHYFKRKPAAFDCRQLFVLNDYFEIRINAGSFAVISILLASLI